MTLRELSLRAKENGLWAEKAHKKGRAKQARPFLTKHAASERFQWSDSWIDACSQPASYSLQVFVIYLFLVLRWDFNLPRRPNGQSFLLLPLLLRRL